MPKHLDFVRIWATGPPPYTFRGKKAADNCVCWGSIVASVGGVVANYLGGYWGNAAFMVSICGLITAIGGLITSVGNQVIAVLKIYSEQREVERKAKLHRIELENQLQGANLKIDELKNVLEDNQARIEDQHRLIMGLNKFREETQSDIKNLSDASLVNSDMINEVDQAGAKLSGKVEGNDQLIRAMRNLVEEYREIVDSQKDRIESQKVRLDFMQKLFAKNVMEISEENSGRENNRDPSPL